MREGPAEPAMDTAWVEPGAMTDAGAHNGLLQGLPADPAGIARVVQGLLIHEFWADAYGVALTAQDREPVNLRRVEQVLDAIVRRDDRPLDAPREPQQRIATNCRGLAVLSVALFRSRGVPARARCGFGAYFTPGWYEDHWVTEYFDGARWRLVDTQIDDLQRRLLGIEFELTDVPRDEFVVAGDAWTMTRAGRADPDRFGLTAIHEAGAWWIAANLMRDAAALVGVELLPWDLWGAMPEPGDVVDVELFDQLAAATAGPSMAQVRQLLADDRLRVPREVFNVQHRRREAL
jgi:transglutaminase superfamily protein